LGVLRPPAEVEGGIPPPDAPLELTDFLRQVKNATTLYQFAKNDDYVARADTAVVMGATSDPKERRFYDTDHAMGLPEVAEDRRDWLVKELKLSAGGGNESSTRR
jgi:hypothetical protein